MRIHKRSIDRGWLAAAITVGLIMLAASGARAEQAGGSDPRWAGYDTHDSHMHLTNYIQEGVNIHDFLKVMG